MNRDLVYGTIRQEILEQKKCQFQMFTASATITAAILAYAGSTKIGGLIYVAPMTLNSLALWMVIDKAISIQRKVGYLQIMETHSEKPDWSWESDLDKFRADANEGGGEEESRKHTFATMVSLLLMSLNIFCAALYFFGPGAATSADLPHLRHYGWLDAACVLILLGGFAAGWKKRNGLVRGNNSTAIRNKWLRVMGLPR